MANTYEWNCKTVDVYPDYEGHTDTVYNAHWFNPGTGEWLEARELKSASDGRIVLESFPDGKTAEEDWALKIVLSHPK